MSVKLPLPFDRKTFVASYRDLQKRNRNSQSSTMFSYRYGVKDDETRLKSILMRFGCRNCEWKGMVGCPMRDKKGHEGKDLTYAHCEMRLLFLEHIYTGKRKKPSLKQLESDFVRYTMHSMYKKGLRDMNKIDRKMSDYVPTGDIKIDSVTENGMKVEYDVIFRRITGLGIELDKLYQKELDRDSRDKNIDKIGARLSLSEFHRKVVTGPVDLIDVDLKETDND